MDESNFQSKVNELLHDIGTLPDSEHSKLESVAIETKQRHAQLGEAVGGLQDSIDYLRLSVKYMLFDLEATRRENRYLRKILEEELDA